MNSNETQAEFDRLSDTDEYIKFERIPESDRPYPLKDVCAMIKLHQVFNTEWTGLEHASHDEVWLSGGFKGNEDNPLMTKEVVLYLVRCGVRYDGESFQMFA